MSRQVETPIGRLQDVTCPGKVVALLECPGCGKWGMINDDQLHGRVSVDHASSGCPGGYHETHDFAAAVERAGGFRDV